MLYPWRNICCTCYSIWCTSFRKFIVLCCKKGKWLITDLFIGFYISHYLMSHSCHMILSFNCLLLCINRLFHMSVFICIHLLIFYFFFCLSLSSYSPFSLILTTSRLFLFINYIVSSSLFTFDFSLSF